MAIPWYLYWMEMSHTVVPNIWLLLEEVVPGSPRRMLRWIEPTLQFIVLEHFRSTLWLTAPLVAVQAEMGGCLVPALAMVGVLLIGRTVLRGANHGPGPGNNCVPWILRVGVGDSPLATKAVACRSFLSSVLAVGTSTGLRQGIQSLPQGGNDAGKLV